MSSTHHLAARATRPDEVTISEFAALGVPAALVAVLDAQQIVSAFPIQTAALPDAFAGCDILGRGRTGSGKTLAYALPVVASLAKSGRREPRRPRGLVLVPTRELANQVAATIRPLAHSLGLRITTVYGGVAQGPQVSALRSGVDIVIACPGRLEDLIAQHQCTLDRVTVTVLDEADHLADLGFLPSVRRLLDQTPARGQRLLFSATLDNGVDLIVKRYLHDPVTHSVDEATAVIPSMTHHVLSVQVADKGAVVRQLAAGQGRTLVFTRTKHGARKLAVQLTSAGIPAVDLHGNLSQGARERNLASFSSGETRVLVATDIAARGIHVDDIELVVHYDPPAEHKAYLHRSGRTARAGANGVVVTVVTPLQESDMRSLARQAGIDPTRTAVGPSHPLLHELSGPRAEVKHAAKVPVAPPSPPAPRRAPANRSRPSRPSRPKRRPTRAR